MAEGEGLTQFFPLKRQLVGSFDEGGQAVLSIKEDLADETQFKQVEILKLSGFIVFFFFHIKTGCQDMIDKA